MVLESSDSGVKAVDAVQTIQRAGEILEMVARAGGAGARLTDIALKTGLGKSTTHRLLTALTRTGLLDQDLQTRGYYLGYRLLSLGEAASNRFQLAELAAPAMDRLALETGETVYLSVRDGNEAVCLARTSGNFPIKILTLNVGDRHPLGRGTASLAILANLPDAETRRIVAENAARWPDNADLAPALLLKLVAEARECGFVRTDGRVVPGISALAAPLLIRDGSAIAAISVAAISPRLEGPRAESALQLLREEVERTSVEVSRVMGPMTSRTAARLASGS